MPLTLEKYQKLQALLKDPNKDFSPEARERAQARLDEFDNRLAGAKYSDEKPVDAPRQNWVEEEGPPPDYRVVGQNQPTTPGALAPAPHPDEAKVQQLVGMLDPGLSLPAQALAVQPGTTHQAGDKGAESEWLSGPLDNPAGRVVYYEPPIDKVREELAMKPELFKMLNQRVPTSADEIASIQEGDSTYEAYANWKWKELAEATLKSGKTAYRFSRAPYLGSGPNASVLDTLSTKLKHGVGPAMEGASAFIGGVDDAAMFGLGNRGAEQSGLGWGGTLNAEDSAALRVKHNLPEPPEGAEGPAAAGAGGDELVNAPDPQEPLADRNARLAEEHPVLHGGGQVTGSALPSGWSLSGKLWDTVMGKPAQTVIGGVASGFGRGAAAAGAEQTVREGVRAASGEGDSLGAAAGRVAASSGAGAIPAALGGGIRGVGNTLLREVEAPTGRYGGAPGRLKARGVETTIGGGHTAPPAVKEAQTRGAQTGRSALTTLADDLDEPLADAANYRQSDVERVGEGNRAEHYASDEGKATLPMRNLVEVAAQRMRKLTSEVPKHGKVAVARGRVQGPLPDILNANIEGVSARPTKNGVELSAREARAFLAPKWLEKLDLKKLEKAGKSVYVTPRRYDSEHADEVIRQLKDSSDEHVSAVHEAALRDRQGRSWSGKKGGWSEVSEMQDRAEGEAADTARRVGASRPGGPRRAVMRAGKSKGQGDDIKALEDTAKRAGKDAPEKLHGAMVAEDLDSLEKWGRLGSLSPRGGQRGFWGLSALGDRGVLRYAYPAARKLEKVKTGTAAAAGRIAETPVRNVLDDRDDEREDKRNAKNAEGYEERAKKAGAGKAERKPERKLVRRRRAESEAR